MQTSRKRSMCDEPIVCNSDESAAVRAVSPLAQSKRIQLMTELPETREP